MAIGEQMRTNAPGKLLYLLGFVHRQRLLANNQMVPRRGLGDSAETSSACSKVRAQSAPLSGKGYLVRASRTEGVHQTRKSEAPLTRQT